MTHRTWIAVKQVVSETLVNNPNTLNDETCVSKYHSSSGRLVLDCGPRGVLACVWPSMAGVQRARKPMKKHWFSLYFNFFGPVWFWIGSKVGVWQVSDPSWLGCKGTANQAQVGYWLVSGPQWLVCKGQENKWKSIGFRCISISLGVVFLRSMCYSTTVPWSYHSLSECNRNAFCDISWLQPINRF